MARSAASIQAEIDRLEAFLASEDSVIESAGTDGTAAKRYDYEKLTKRLDRLYLQLGRANGTSPMFVRSRVKGLR